MGIIVGAAPVSSMASHEAQPLSVMCISNWCERSLHRMRGEGDSKIMKRFAFKLAICLVLGAVINIAVAWGCVVCGPIQGQQVARQGLSKRATDADRVWWNE